MSGNALGTPHFSAAWFKGFSLLGTPHFSAVCVHVLSVPSVFSVRNLVLAQEKLRLANQKLSAPRNAFPGAPVWDYPRIRNSRISRIPLTMYSKGKKGCSRFSNAISGSAGTWMNPARRGYPLVCASSSRV